MDKTTAETELSFTQPIRQIILMLIVIMLVLAGAFVAWGQLSGVFLANIWLNGFIGLVFVFGVLACFWQVLQLMQSVRWIWGFARPEAQGEQPPRLLAPLATLLRSRGARMQLSSSSSRSILDSVATRIDEARDITRYLVNLLIFLGLLGTFYGLATTVPAVVETIRNLAPQEGETGMQVFDKLMGGLEAQLGGMGTAFSSSLLGLAGSLVVGMLELFASHGQNRFYRELEEWMSSITRLGFSPGEGETDSAGLALAMEQIATQLEQLQALFVQADIARTLADEQVETLSDAVKDLTAKVQDSGKTQEHLARIALTQTQLLTRIADGQDSFAGVLAKSGEAKNGDEGPDAESRMRLRSIDVQLLRILEELSAGRQESTTDLRADIAGLTNAVRQLSRSTGKG